MNFFKLKEYNSIKDYLVRKTIFRTRSFHIRLHNILSEDKTPFLHTHPFNYISIILNGGYTERILINNQLKEIKHNRFSFIFRKGDVYHRIDSVKPNTKTLFITWKLKSIWELKKHKDIKIPDDYICPNSSGIYKCCINNKNIYAKFINGEWYIGSASIIESIKSTKLSIHQNRTFSKII